MNLMAVMISSSVNSSRALLCCAVLFLFAMGSVPAWANTAPQHSSQNYEPAILEILESINAGELEQALAQTDQHLAEYPKSRVAYMLKGDILQAMVHNPVVMSESQSVEITPASEQPAETTQGIRHQLRNRWLHQAVDADRAHTQVPASLLDMGVHEYVMVSDMQAGRLYLYRNNQGVPELVRDYYLSVGSQGYGKEVEGDNKTPVGVYAFYQHIAGEKLPDLYGKGAYPVNYPNRLDRALNRTGYGIWLHGTPSNTYARAPWASEGCFVLSNDDLLDIEKYIDIETRTPVVLADQIEWVSLAELQSRRDELRRAIAQWKRDWESLNTKAYLSHYSRDYFNFGTDSFSAWAARKRKVNAAKTFIQVDTDIESMFLYPGQEDMFIVHYTQRYLSNNYAGQAKKEQYWQRDDLGRWQIVYES